MSSGEEVGSSSTRTAQESSSAEFVASRSSGPNDAAGAGPASTDAVDVDIRGALGRVMDGVSTKVNDNLIVARWAASSTILLLTAYGLSQTPLFFRFYNVKEIPSSYFTNRKTIPVRLVSSSRTSSAWKDDLSLNQQQQRRIPHQPVTLYVQHLSPVGQWLLSRGLWKWTQSIKPSTPRSIKLHKFNNNGKNGIPGRGLFHDDHANHDDDHDGVMRIELAGLTVPNSHSNYQKQQPLLGGLVKDGAYVKIQLLGRKKVVDKVPVKDEQQDQDQIAVCRLYYRPSLSSILSTDIADPLVKSGQAVVNENGLFSVIKNDDDDGNDEQAMAIIEETSTRVQDLRRDVKYLERLTTLETQAIKGQYGIWSDPHLRNSLKPDVVEEIEFQSSATLFQKIWRWIRQRY
jgi:hypothetical protein